MSSKLHFYLIDEEKLRTYLFLNLITGDAIEIEPVFLKFELRGVEYTFGNLTILVRTRAMSKNAEVLTTEGFVRWENPARRVSYSGRKDTLDPGTYITPNSYTEIICSNYICSEYPSENYIKITKSNLIVYDFPSQKNLDVEIEEKNDELIITNKRNVSAWLGVKIDDVIYPFYSLDPLTEHKIILTKGTCFKVAKYNVYVIKGEEKNDFKYSNKEVYLCYL